MRLSTPLPLIAASLCISAQFSAVHAQNADNSSGNGNAGQGFARWQSLSPEERQARLAKFREMRGARGNGQGLSGAQSARANAENSGAPQASTQNCNVRTDIAYGKDPAQKIDVYSPKSGVGLKPVLFFVHGGGWTNGDKKSYSAKGAAYADNGIVMISVNYRLAPSVMHPKQIEDIADAFAYTKAHIAEYGGDPNNIVIMGHSAGAQLVDLLGTNERFLKAYGLSFKDIAAVVSLDTASLDLTTRKDDSGPETEMVGGMVDSAFGTNPKILADASPTLCIHPGPKYPKFLMYCGSSRANCVAQHKKFSEAMEKAGGQVTVCPVPLSHRDVNKESGHVGSQMFNSIMALLTHK